MPVLADHDFTIGVNRICRECDAEFATPGRVVEDQNADVLERALGAFKVRNLPAFATARTDAPTSPPSDPTLTRRPRLSSVAAPRVARRGPA